MKQSENQSRAPRASSTPETGRPNEAARRLEQAEALLRAGQPKKALDVLGRSGPPSDRVTNAVGVCLLRLGEAGRAVEVFRGLALVPGTVCLRPDAPALYKTNFATALLAAGQVAGGLRVLDEIGDEQQPTVRRLRAAWRRWSEGLSLWQKVRWCLGDSPTHPVALGEAPGEL
jgi:hypothetical protein